MLNCGQASPSPRTMTQRRRDALSQDRILLYRALSVAFGSGPQPSPGTKISGQGSTRDEAIEKAKKAIARATQKQRFKHDTVGEDRDD